MKIIEPSVELAQDLNAAEIMRHIERAGRVCYKSESNISDTSAEKFIANIIKSGHESVIEHVSITFKIICDRGISHEIVRHRLASYCVSGDTIIASYSTNKKFTIEDIFKSFQAPKYHAAFKALTIKSFDEQTHTIKPNKIKNVFFNGVKEVFQLTTERGRVIKCTPEHQFFTDSGWKQLKNISAGNVIYSSAEKFQIAPESDFCKTEFYKAFKDKVAEICYVGKMKVYDLEMEEPYHNYIANGIVVHNSQESSRYVDYSAGKFGGELTFIKPCYWNDNDENYLLWLETMQTLEKNYLAMRKAGARPEQARAILPNSLKTEIFMTANLREWRHFLKLRTSKRAHPQMRQIALKIFEILNANLPVIFSDIKPDE